MSTPPVITKRELGALRQIQRKEPARECCELCNTPVREEHPHLLQRSSGLVLCACEACGVLFSYRSADRDLVRIPRDLYRLGDFQMSATDWNALRLPIELAFFVISSRAKRPIAYYPSPAGCTESLLDLDAWNEIVRNNPVLEGLEGDVEALLVNRMRGGEEYFIVPIDHCYELTGLIRRHWRGFSGGQQVWGEIDSFFAKLRERSLKRRGSTYG